MFYNEEGNEEAIEFLKSRNLPMGRILYPITSTTIPNAVLTTKGGGPFWYGDIDTASWDLEIINEMSISLGEQVETVGGFNVKL